jgi:heme-degrading monooxygenase HmoA
LTASEYKGGGFATICKKSNLVTHRCDKSKLRAGRVFCPSSQRGEGFVEFHLLKGPEAEDHTLYASHTVWENRAVFEAWTKSEAFWERITARNDRSWRKAVSRQDTDVS